MEYPDRAALDDAVTHLRTLPPLVTSSEVERLRTLLAEAERGERFVLQGGDCAERISDCTSDRIAATLKVLLQVSLVLTHATGAPVVRIGRLAGQYAKPRTSPTETRFVRGAPLTLPSYRGDLVNSEDFDADARRPEPWRMVRAYHAAALTLNFVRSLLMGGFADLRHPEHWDLGVLHKAGLPRDLRDQYQRTVADLMQRLRVAELGIGDSSRTRAGAWETARTELFTSHEALNLYYESAQTRTVPRREGHYDLTTHLPWIGERTRDPGGAHVEFCRGIRNPVGVKIGPAATAEQVVSLLQILNPDNEAGRVLLIARLGAGAVRRVLPGLVEAVQRGGHRALWICDPMHANTVVVSPDDRRAEDNPGIKTRRFDDMMEEVRASIEVHAALGSRLGGLHLEVTGEDVTECLGGAGNVGESDLPRRYETACDPRLNYEQSLELALRIAPLLDGNPAKSRPQPR